MGDDRRTPRDDGNLVDGLVGPYADLFHKSASFRDNVNYLAGILPVWIKAMAEVAVLQDEQMELMKQTIIHVGPLAREQIAELMKRDPRD